MQFTSWLPPHSNALMGLCVLCSCFLLLLFGAVCLGGTLQDSPQPQPGPAGFFHSQGVRAAVSPSEGPFPAAGTLLDGACESAAYRAPGTTSEKRERRAEKALEGVAHEHTASEWETSQRFQHFLTDSSNRAKSKGAVRTVKVSSLPPTSSNFRDGYCSSADFDFAATQFAMTTNSWSETWWSSEQV